MQEDGTQKWVGRSDEIALPMLGGDFWKEMTEISGVLEGGREQKFGGVAYRVTLDNPVVVDGEECTEVELPASLTGIKNALQALREKDYSPRRGDLWRVTCVKIKKAKKADYSDSPEFEIGVIRRAVAAA